MHKHTQCSTPHLTFELCERVKCVKVGGPVRDAMMVM